MKKKLINKFIKWWYKKELEQAKYIIETLPIDVAVYELQELSKKIHPKTDAIKELNEMLNKRIGL